MRYRDIQPTSNRFRLPPSHPILAQIVIDPVDWFQFERLNDDNPAVRILGHDAPQNAKMVVYVACGSAETCTRLEDGWR